MRAVLWWLRKSETEIFVNLLPAAVAAVDACFKVLVTCLQQHKHTHAYMNA